jgi:hypothetical protein
MVPAQQCYTLPLLYFSFLFPIRADECDDSFSWFCTHNTCQMYIRYIYTNTNELESSKDICKKNLKVLFVSMAGGQRHRRTNNKKGQFSDINK